MGRMSEWGIMKGARESSCGNGGRHEFGPWRCYRLWWLLGWRGLHTAQSRIHTHTHTHIGRGGSRERNARVERMCLCVCTVAGRSPPFPSFSRTQFVCVCVLRRILRDSRLHVEWARGGTASSWGWRGGWTRNFGTHGPFSPFFFFSFRSLSLSCSILSLSLCLFPVRTM